MSVGVNGSKPPPTLFVVILIGVYVNRNMGPVLAGTVVVENLDNAIEIYTRCLMMKVAMRGAFPEQIALAWDKPNLAGKRYCVLESQSGSKWLRFIELAESRPAKPISDLGWMALEVLVENVYELASTLKKGTDFRFIGEAAPLDVSPAISACQVVGPSGEVLYLTSISEPVPPFELPIASASVDTLFIPVLAVPNRTEAMCFYEGLAQSKPLAFDTKVTVVNRALERDIQQKLPVCTVQLDGNSLIEIDEVSELPQRQPLDQGLVNGVALVSFEVQSFEVAKSSAIGEPYSVSDAFYLEREAQLFRGPSGELIELVLAQR